MTDLRTAAQQVLNGINELFTAEQSEGGGRSGHIRTPATREHLVRIAQARKALHESCDALRAGMNAQNELDEAMRTPRAMAQAYEAGWKAALAQLELVGWMQKSTGVIRCDWGFDTTGYVPVYAAQEQPE